MKIKEGKPLYYGERKFPEILIENSRLFSISEGYVFLTKEGKELVKSMLDLSAVLKALKFYRRDIKKRENTSARSYIGNGANGVVYKVGDTDIVIKESTSRTPLVNALARMLTLTNAVATNPSISGFCSVVKSYCLVSSKELDKEYLIMEKIDNGISFQDLRLYVGTNEARNPTLTHAIGLIFPDFNHDDLKIVENLIAKIMAQPEMADLLRDLNAGNFLVFPNTDGNEPKFRICIIDQ